MSPRGWEAGGDQAVKGTRTSSAPLEAKSRTQSRSEQSLIHPSTHCSMYLKAGLHSAPWGQGEWTEEGPSQQHSAPCSLSGGLKMGALKISFHGFLELTHLEWLNGSCQQLHEHIPCSTQCSTALEGAAGAHISPCPALDPSLW